MLWLVRHGETEWSRDGKHTSTTDLPLTDQGTEVARTLAPVLAAEDFEAVLTSPRQRAVRTAELAGFPDAEPDEDLVEWDYGDYEGRTTPEIREEVPGWSVWTHPVPGGETAEEVATRLDRVVARAQQVEGDTLVFAHGHALRALAARWVQAEVSFGRHLRLDTGTVGVLGWERSVPVVLRWNAPAATMGG